ncbi:hypothetical protein DAMA08_043520 [Martiniozyma asiatica (nom. inval.)]|nr:hypothetical protein DAMA08_043520 [Martiniozyma asiatica]
MIRIAKTRSFATSMCKAQIAVAKPKLTHLTENGDAHMVDISQKPSTTRTAVAFGRIIFSNPDVASLITSGGMKKGDVLSVSRIAGIMAVKKTPELIPLCHTLNVSKITVDFKTNASSVDCELVVKSSGQTGVEMEALVGVTTALNTIYDMCKAVDKAMTITDIKILEKRGGKSDWGTSV